MIDFARRPLTARAAPAVAINKINAARQELLCADCRAVTATAFYLGRHRCAACFDTFWRDEPEHIATRAAIRQIITDRVFDCGRARTRQDA